MRVTRMLHRLVIFALCGAALAAPGCVRRRLTVRSAPAGATVYVDKEPIGETPVSVPFTYYGTREIRLVKDNFETLTVKQTFNPPWYQYPVIEFFSENLWPWEIRDERQVDFQMIPQQIVPTERLLERGQELRDAAAAGTVTPLVTPGEQAVVPLPESQLPPPANVAPPGNVPPPGSIPPPGTVLPPGRTLP